MSHSTVLVVGRDPEKQLAPFDENLAVEARWENQDPQDTQRMMEYYLKEEPLKRAELAPAFAWPRDADLIKRVVQEHGHDWSGDQGRVLDNGIVQFRTTRNLRTRWDWYQLGGRWAGFFKIIEGRPGVLGKFSFMVDANIPPHGRVDQARKGDIDFVGMRREAKAEAEYRYRLLNAVTAGIERPPQTWAQAIEGKFPEEIDEIRREWNAHPWICAVKKNDDLYSSFTDPMEEYCVLAGGRETYVRKMVDRSCVTFAVLKDGEWYERGEMGWWGVVHGEKDQDEWNRKWHELVDDLPAETLLSVYDVHI